MNQISTEETVHLEQFLSSNLNIDADNLLEIRTFKNAKPYKIMFCSSVKQTIDFINGLEDKVDIYYGMASRRDTTSGTKQNCRLLNCLFLDIDCGNDGHKKASLFPDIETALNFIENLTFPQPSIIVNSGHGLHLYWRLKNEINLDSKSVTELEGLMKEMAVIFGADSTQDVSRVFRLPFTNNCKETDVRRCEIIKTDYDLKYDIDYLRSNELFKLQLNKIKAVKNSQHNYYEGLFGIINSWDTDDRSRIDQSLITFLINAGYKDQEIELIFENFLTTGKYKENNSTAYLTHSIAKARQNKEQIYIKEERSIMNKEQDYFKCVGSGSEIGYYEKNKDGEYIRLNNFIVQLNYRVTKVRNDEIESFYPGEVLIENNKYPFKKVNTVQLTDSNSFKKFVHNQCGTKIFINSPASVMRAIMHFNKDIPEYNECAFGFNKDLDEYVTGTHVIRKNGIDERYTPIKYSEVWGNNSLGFKYLDHDEIQNLILDLINIYIPIQELEVTLIALAFALYPFIYPYLKDEYPNKFYLMLCGTSGSGKSTLAKLLQNIFGTFNNLFSWTSTDTSIAIVGSSFKDALFVIDDLKATNFRHEKDISRAMGIIQNYSDGNSRNRGRSDMSLNDIRVIEGQLLLTGEDLIFTESSTISRGIIVGVNSKPMDYDKFSKMEELTKKISGITPFLIQSLMNNHTKESIVKIFRECRKEITNFNLMDFGISNDNYSRSINNAAALYTSWKVFSNILLFPVIGEKYHDVFPKLLKDVLFNNLKRVNTYRQDKLFENLLWESIQNRKLKLREYNLSGTEINEYAKNETVGSFMITKEKSVELVLSLKTALREIKRFAPELNITVETLMNKLITEKKIHATESNKHRLAGHSINGVKWVGEIPKSIFDIDQNDPVEQINEILEQENQKEWIEDLFNDDLLTTEKMEPGNVEECPVFNINENQKEIKKKQSIEPERVPLNLRRSS